MPDQKQVLVLGNKPNEESNRQCPALFFSQLGALFLYIAENLSKIDQFIVFIPFGNLLELMSDPNYLSSQVRIIHVFYTDTDQLNRDKESYQHGHRKLKFCHERTLEAEFQKLATNVALSGSGSVDAPSLQSMRSDISLRMAGKRSALTTDNSVTSKRICARSDTGSLHHRGEPIAEKYICPWCQLIIQIPHQLECGHRLCESCIADRTEIVCLVCDVVSSKDKCRFDQGFYNEMERISIPCATCQKNVSLDSLREYDEQKQYDAPESAMDICPHTQVLSSWHLIRSPLPRTSLPETPSNKFTAVLKRWKLLFQRMKLRRRLAHFSNSVQVVIPDSFSFPEQGPNCQLRPQEVAVLTRSHEDSVVRQSDGSWLCTVKNVAEKMSMYPGDSNTTDRRMSIYEIVRRLMAYSEQEENAQSGTMQSIYLPVFHTSVYGYQMSLRLYLSGDRDTRGQFSSLFFVLMKGDYDAVLPWPFPSKVTVSLIDQSVPNNTVQGVTRSFHPDLHPSSFQRPRGGMNEGYGFKQFISLQDPTQDLLRYVKDDTCLIRVWIGDESPNPELPFTRSILGAPNDGSDTDTVDGQSLSDMIRM